MSERAWKRRRAKRDWRELRAELADPVSFARLLGVRVEPWQEQMLRSMRN